jgi:two-component system, OmpR family, sensor histidine kinase BaeS
MVLRETVEAFEERYRKKNLTLTLDVSQTPCIANADSNRLKQLFSNVLENSLRYTREGGALAILGKEDQQSLVVQFDDTAPGLTAELIPRVFERFFRAEVSRNRSFGGTGLGLAICKTIAEAHGGTITASQSRLGGVTIEISLPLLRPDTDGK